MDDAFLLDEELHHDATRDLTIRLGGTSDAAAVDPAAALDERDAGAGPHVVACEDGTPSPLSS